MISEGKSKPSSFKIHFLARVFSHLDSHLWVFKWAFWLRIVHYCRKKQQPEWLESDLAVQIRTVAFNLDFLHDSSTSSGRKSSETPLFGNVPRNKIFRIKNYSLCLHCSCEPGSVSVLQRVFTGCLSGWFEQNWWVMVGIATNQASSQGWNSIFNEYHWKVETQV